MTTHQGKLDLFRVSIGDTERDVTEIMKHIRQNSALPIANIVSGKPSGPVGQVQVDIFTQAGVVDEKAVRMDLSTYADCMYQVESVKKVKE